VPALYHYQFFGIKGFWLLES